MLNLVGVLCNVERKENCAVSTALASVNVCSHDKDIIYGDKSVELCFCIPGCVAIHNSVTQHYSLTFITKEAVLPNALQ